MVAEDNNGRKVSLREYFDTLITERCKTIDARFDLVDHKIKSTQEAIFTSKEVMDTRLASLNELRQQVVDDREQYLRCDVYSEKVKGYDIWVDGVNKDLTAMKTRNATWMAAGGLIVLITNIAVILLVHFL